TALCFLFVHRPPSPELYTLSLHDALPISEASTSNLFARLDGNWCTPPLAAGILAGITRSLLLEFLASRGETCAERDLHADELGRSEEHTSELQSRENLVCRLLLEKKNT